MRLNDIKKEMATSHQFRGIEYTNVCKRMSVQELLWVRGLSNYFIPWDDVEKITRQIANAVGLDGNKITIEIKRRRVSAANIGMQKLYFSKTNYGFRGEGLPLYTIVHELVHLDTNSHGYRGYNRSAHGQEFNDVLSKFIPIVIKLFPDIKHYSLSDFGYNMIFSEADMNGK